MAVRTANSLWWLASAPGAFQFWRSVHRLEDVQAGVLRAILHQNRDTGFGRQHGFARIKGVSDFRSQVPLRRYEDFLPYMESAAAGKRGVLTIERIDCFCPSSGSATASKMVPHTKALRSQFRAGISPWIFDMFCHHPGLLQGRAYWSISPPGRAPVRTAGGIPVGLVDDASYLGPFSRLLLRGILAVPPEVALLSDMAAFRYTTLAFLVAAGDLALISVWSPTFLTLLLHGLRSEIPRLVSDLERGAISQPAGVPGEVADALNGRLGRHPVRAAQVYEMWRQHTSDETETLPNLLWPRLKLLSCWTEGAARGPAEELRRLFPGVPVVGKGLLATEGIVTLPRERAPAGVLAVRSHFFEFLPVGEEDRPLSAWEIVPGEKYEVVLTTAGGLYRYRLGDIVRVKGFHGQCPLLEFLGRGDKVSDLCGEKLNEGHVSAVLDAALSDLPVRPTFALLAPLGTGGPARYRLFLAGGDRPGETAIEDIARRLEAGLSENVHYGYCRDLGQLLESDVLWIGEDADSAFRKYERVCLERGQSVGGIKPPTLDRSRGWQEILVDS